MNLLVYFNQEKIDSRSDKDLTEETRANLKKNRIRFFEISAQQFDLKESLKSHIKVILADPDEKMQTSFNEQRQLL